MNTRIFVDGQEGTTGLRIHEYLAARSDLKLLAIDPAKRKDAAERKALLNACDIAILCLPEAASREAVSLIENDRTRVIDASTAFRTDPSWAYGLPELSRRQREKIRTARSVAVPGCHASAFILSVAPLVASGIVPTGALLTCVSLTGYSGGGKKMIAAYEAADARPSLRGPRPYALKLLHKHLPEMQKIPGLAHPPLFTPVVCNIYQGLAVETFLPAAVLRAGTGIGDIHETLARHYQGEKFVRVMPLDPEASGPQLDEGCLDITACNGTNRADIFVFGHDAASGPEPQTVVFTRLDNLGKGAAGAAVQCLNLMLGADEGLGLKA